MKKNTVLILALLLCFALSPAQTYEELQDMGQNVLPEKSPFTSSVTISPLEAIWDLQVSFDLEVATGALGNAGAEFDGTHFYSTRWASNLIHEFDLTGTLIREFSVTGVSGLRDLAYDGTYFYGGASSTTIYQMDFATSTLIGTITSPVAVRFIAYDEANDAFWVGNWSDPPTLVDRNGATLSTITTGLAGQYGAAYDGWSSGGPYLWVFDQGAGAGTPQLIQQFDIATGTATGVSYDVTTDFPTTAGIAGGLWTGTGVVPGIVSIGGVLQGTPDMYFSYELAPYGDPLDPLPPTNFTAFSDISTPTDMLLTWNDPTNYVNGDTLINFQVIIARDGITIDSVASGVETYTDMGLTQYTEYTYDIWAKDTADSTSPMASATWMAGGYPPIMVVDPASISDTLLVGGTSTHVMTITNNQGNPGPLDYTITENPAVGWLSVSSTAGTVAPASFVELDVDINSTGLTAGLYTTELIVAGNDPFNAEDTVAVSLQVNEAPIVGFTPDSMHFTLDPTGVAFPVKDSTVMTISNTGLGPLDWATGAAAPELMYYKFDEVGAAQTQNFADPSTPVPQFAGVLGGLSMGGTGFSGAALIGSGGSSSTDYVDTGWPTNLTSDFTISFWLNNLGTTFGYLFGDNTAGSFRCFTAGAAGVDNLLVRFGGVGGTDVTITGVGPACPCVVDIIYDSSVPEVRAYVNGTLNVTVPQAGLVSIVGTAPFKVAGYSSSAGIGAGTLMDEWKLYDRAIDITEAPVENRQSWLSTNPASGIVAPGGTQDVWVIADATGLIGGEYDGGVHIISNDPVHPDTTMPVGLTAFGTPQIIVDPLILQFDTILVGASATLPVTVSNTGSFPLSVDTITTSNPDFSVDTTTFMVDVAASQIVNVTFNPQTAQTYSETMSIFSDDPVTPIVLVTLEGTANEAPIVGVSPDSFHFDLLSGEMDSAQFTISNTGNGPLDFSLTDEDLSENLKTRIIDRSYLRPEFNVDIPKGTPDWRVGTPQTEGAGGPDLFGYKWIDSDEPGGPVFNWIDISSTGTPVVGLGDDAFVGPFPLGFTFSYYGADYTDFYICSNGFLGFGPNTTGYTSLSNAQIPTAATPNNILPWMWDDLNPSTGGFIYYETVGNQLIVQFVEIPEYGGSGTVTAEVMINSNGSMLYQYLEFLNGIDISSSTVGIENIDGTDGLQVNFNDPTYLHDNLAIKYSKESEWLSENPTSGTILPGGSMDIWAIANATGLLGGDYLATVVVNSNDPVNPEVRLPRVSMHVTGVPRVSVYPDPLVFDTAFVGATPQLELTVENIGTDQLDVTSITSSDPVFTLDTTSLSIAPFSTYPVTVTFTPNLPGDYSADIVFVTNDPVTPNDTVTVTAVAIEAPVAVVNPLLIEATVNLNDSTDEFINVANAGGNDLVWSAVALSAPAAPPMERQHYTPVSPSQTVEAAPDNGNAFHGFSIESPWDLQFSFDLEIASGALGNAGAEFDGTYYYTTRWASALIHKYDMAGNMVQEFSVAGVSGLRDLAYDGTYFYGGAAANTIYMMDFDTQTLVGTISSPVGVRNIAYDEANDAFWVGNWSDPPTLVDRSGATLATLTTGLAGQYGAAYDDWSEGGPYLWVFDQGAGAGTPQLIHQFDLNTMTATGFTHDVTVDIPGTAGIAGGLWTGEGVVGGKASIGGCLQGTPDMFFVYELTDAGPTWIKLLMTSGVVGPGDNVDVPVRIYGDSPDADTAWVAFSTNDPGAQVINVEVRREVVTGIGDVETLPTTFAVSQNYPNPFNPSTTIKYQLPQSRDVTLQIFNVLGQKVRTLVNSKVEAGYHQAIWDGRNDIGNQVASGIYIYRFEAGDFQRTMKLMLLK